LPSTQTQQHPSPLFSSVWGARRTKRQIVISSLFLLTFVRRGSTLACPDGVLFFTFFPPPKIEGCDASSHLHASSLGLLPFPPFFSLLLDCLYSIRGLSPCPPFPRPEKSAPFPFGVSYCLFSPLSLETETAVKIPPLRSILTRPPSLLRCFVFPSEAFQSLSLIVVWAVAFCFAFSLLPKNRWLFFF